MDKLKDVEFYSVHNTAGSITYLFSVSAHQHMSEGKCSFSSEGCNIHDRETNRSLQHMQKSKERKRKKSLNWSKAETEMRQRDQSELTEYQKILIVQNQTDVHF